MHGRDTFRFAAYTQTIHWKSILEKVKKKKGKKRKIRATKVIYCYGRNYADPFAFSFRSPFRQSG